MGQFVALLDILGFKDIINKNKHEDVVHLFNNFRIYVQMSLANQKSTTDEYGATIFDVYSSTINSTIISDSLIFWTNDNNANDFFELLNCLQFFISFCHNLPFIFLRGGITYGDFFYHNNGVIKGQNTIIIHPLMVGKALVEVYEIEKKLQIAGCVISDTAIKEAKANNPLLFEEKWNELITSKKLVEYEMPLKNGTKKFWTINWVRDLADPDITEMTKGFASFNKDISSNEVKEKIKNTIDFYSYIKKEIYKNQ